MTCKTMISALYFLGHIHRMSECIGRIFAQVTGIKDFLYLWTHHSPPKKFLMIIKAFNSAINNPQFLDAPIIKDPFALPL